MRLKPVQTYTDVSLKGRVPGELHAALTAYASYYHETIGQPIEVWPLIVQMLQRFVETGPRVPDVAAPDSERGWTGTGDELRGGGGERRGRKKGMVRQDKKSPHVRRKPASPLDKS